MKDLLQALLDEMLMELRALTPPSTIVYPAGDVILTKDQVWIFLDLPGVPKEAIQVTFQEPWLIIKGKKPRNTTVQGRYFCSEREYGAFNRVIRIPGVINPYQGKAILSQGTLTITLPRVKERRKKSISIEVIHDE